MADRDHTSNSQSTRNQDLPNVPAGTSASLEQAIEAERRKLLQVHGLLHCLYEVLLYADGEDTILYAQAAELGAEVLNDSVARLDSTRIKPVIEAATRARSAEASTRRDDRVEEPRAVYHH